MGLPKGFPKPPGSGRKKGQPNKLTRDVKAMILGALEAHGGQEYLEKQALENPVAFMSLIGRVLPLTVAGDPNNPLQVVATITRKIISQNDGRKND